MVYENLCTLDGKHLVVLGDGTRVVSPPPIKLIQSDASLGDMSSKANLAD